ncbi:MAG: galM2 [Gemmatimonadetes bacterium]|nr:galM2 [Gemmatimonadota bacterium]
MTAGRTQRSPFGRLPDGRRVELHTVVNVQGTELRFLNLGGILQSLRVADRDGNVADITPGYDSLDGYLADTRYFGALIGRYANRIAGGTFELDGRCYSLAVNNAPNHLHGGLTGFSSVLWDVEPFQGRSGAGAVLSHVSPDGHGGYPGTLDVRITYTLSDDNELRFDYFATTDAPTPVNFTQHTYFNLSGESAASILDHELELCGSRFTPVTETLIPTGEICDVKGTPFDFTVPRRIGVCIAASNEQLARGLGYDHNFVIDDTRPGTLHDAALVTDPASGRTLEIETTEPGIQFYSGNQIAGGPLGKNGRAYMKHSAFALETQHFPDSPNQPLFPPTILRPGAAFHSTTVYRFGVTDYRGE